MLAASNDRIKRLRRLVNQRQARSSERAFVVEGPVLVAEALTAHRQSETVEVLEVYVDESEPSPPPGATDIDQLHWVRAGVLSQVLDTIAPQPVCAVVRVADRRLEDLGPGPILAAVDLRDPGNAGAILRTAEAAGFAAVALLGSSVDTTNPKVVRASAGARLRLPVLRLGGIDDAYRRLRNSGRIVVATVVEATAPDHTTVDLANSVIVLGNEAAGLDAAAVTAADRIATIRLAGPTESLNVAAAAAVLCFESLRQRRAAGD